MPMQMDMKEIDDFPWMAVFIDQEEQPRYTFDIRQSDQDYILWSSDQEEEHTIRVMKLSEANFSSIAIHSLSIDGEFLEIPENKKRKIEFIGDSITCGFGNMPTEADRLFFNNEENGWLTYGAVAARLLGMEPAMLCCSGISVRKHEPMAAYGILDLYEYADRIREDKSQRELTKWSFNGDGSDFVVVNLGTNDRNAVNWSNGEYTQAKFEEDYLALLAMVRKYNPNAKIICALGSMDYFLYDCIVETVSRFKAQNKDEEVYTFKFSPMMLIGPDVGGCMHPSKFKHDQMGRELAEFIRKVM